VELPLLVAFGVLVAREAIFEREQMIGLKAGIDRVQREQAAGRQTRAGQQHHRQRQLCHHQKALHAPPRPAGAARAPRLVEHLV
jgi:hypothetical protein